MDKDCVGAIVCKLDMHKKIHRGYIAMLAVDSRYRRKGIGKWALGGSPGWVGKISGTFQKVSVPKTL